MHGSNITRGDVLPSIQPLVIARADFEKLYPVYQKMALALAQTGDVLIVDTIQPSVSSENPSLLSEQANNKPHLPPEGAPIAMSGHALKRPWGCLSIPERAFLGLPAMGAEGVSPSGGGFAAPTLGYYTLIRTATPENEWRVES